MLSFKVGNKVYIAGNTDSGEVVYSEFLYEPPVTPEDEPSFIGSNILLKGEDADKAWFYFGEYLPANQPTAIANLDSLWAMRDAIQPRIAILNEIKHSEIAGQQKGLEQALRGLKDGSSLFEFPPERENISKIKM